jgi:hypothetical protein
MFHYTYMITSSAPTDSRYKYIGVRSSTKYPTEDVYYGSCIPFKEWQKEHGVESLSKQILAIWDSKELAIEHEIRLHNVFNVGINEEFWNQVKQTSTGFDVTGTKFSEEHKEKLRIAGKKRHHPKASEETKNKMSAAKKGKSLSTWHKKKISEGLTGKPSPIKGQKRSAEYKQKMSDMFKGIPKEKTTCPHCGMVGSVCNMKRYHFDNCKGLDQ